ncbi:OmpA family protein [Luteolibacter flavescens]|uniref:OmpA family protein n=1 Tax=Luteolibacter flavescens TaxID=1859460 RepID=A0ABT3FTR5_9BACT|nr:OmpA family protein [Luteolibacter flavescens]MCW1886978.1 OmpA family protein [Luteolibacter flavescens]
MDDGYSWRESRESMPLRLPGATDKLGWWAGVAFFIAIILHVAAFFALGHIKIGMGFVPSAEIETGPVQIEQVEILPPDRDLTPPVEDNTPPPDTMALMEEIDILAKLPEDTEIDLKPDLSDPEFAIRLSNPALEGESSGVIVDPSAGFDIDTALPELGRTAEPMPLAADAQIIVDPGAAVVSDNAIDRFAEDLMKKGVGGTAAAGTLDGVVSLDDMAGLPADVLVGKMTMLPSDLLFEYNSAELRESARVGMMKLAMILEKNPQLYCWIEGHSDLFGTDHYNLELSKRRAAAVENYLTRTFFLPSDKIETRGFGKTKPLLKQGSVDEQAPNRRVEIRMRRKPAPPQIVIAAKEPAPTPAPPVAEPAPQPPKQTMPPPVLVKPQRALPVEEDDIAPPSSPRAKPVEETAPRMKPLPEPPKARPVEEPAEEEPPRAAEVIEEPEPEPEPQRAIPVE